VNEHGSIGGRVLRADGRPAVDAVVHIAESTVPHPDIAQVTNDDGQFRFDALPPGTYTVLVRLEDDVDAESRERFVIGAGERVDRDVRLES